MSQASNICNTTASISPVTQITPTEVLPELAAAPYPRPTTLTRADMLLIVRPSAIDRGIIWCRDHLFSRYQVHDLRGLTNGQLAAVLARIDAEDAAQAA